MAEPVKDDREQNSDPVSAGAMRTSGTWMRDGWGAIVADPDARRECLDFKSFVLTVGFGLISLIVTTGAAFVAELWIHFLLNECDLHDMRMPPWARESVVLFTGVAIVGMACAAGASGFRDAWLSFSARRVRGDRTNGIKGKENPEPQLVLPIAETATTPTATAPPPALKTRPAPVVQPQQQAAVKRGQTQHRPPPNRGE